MASGTPHTQVTIRRSCKILNICSYQPWKFKVPFFTILCFLLQTATLNAFTINRADILKEMANNPKILKSSQLLTPFTKAAQEINIIVSLNSSLQAKALSGVSPTGSQSNQKNRDYNLKDKDVKQKLRMAVNADLTKFLKKIDSKQVQVKKRFHYTFGFSATVTIEGLANLLAKPELASISEDMTLRPHTRQGIALLHGEVIRRTYDGSGIAIAIIDTGIDTAHPMLGATTTFPNTKVIGGYDMGDNDPDPRPDAINGAAHGTACAGIAAGERTSIGDYIGGVAPGAKLYSLKITEGNEGTTLASSMIAALEWCITHQYDDLNAPLLIISTSFGGGTFSSSCDDEIPAMTQTAANAVSAGITLFASAGNEGYCNALSWPACITSINSVGAVYDAPFGTYYPCVSPSSCADKTFTSNCGDFNYYATDYTAADQVASYSNNASFLTLFAPSNMAYTTDISGPGGYGNGDYVNFFGGTSASSPYAAGAAAILQHASKTKTGNYLTPNEVKDYLVQYGDTVTDSKVSTSKSRINLEQAVNKLPIGTTYIISSFSDPHGTIGPLGRIIVAEHANQTFSIQPAPGYRISEILVDGTSTGAGNPYTFNAITTNHTISASFEVRPKSSFSKWLPLILSIISSRMERTVPLAP